MRRTLLLIHLLCYVLLSSTMLHAQKTDVATTQLKFSYGLQNSGLDLADRFGSHFSLGLALEHMPKEYLSLGLEFNLQFGNQVRQDVLSGLRSDRGIIIGDNETKADVFLRQRGAYYGIYAGYIRTIGSPKGPHYVHFALGVGLWQHKIRIVADGNTVPQLRREYKKGYDRLSNGPALKPSINYTHRSLKSNAYFFVQLEMLGGIIRNRRDWDFATEQKLDEKRTDLSYGLRVGWVLTIGKRSLTQEDIYY